VSARFLGAELAAWRPEQGPRRIADFVDHTLLKAEAARTDILKLCEEAKRHRFTAVCVNPYWVPLCSEELLDSGVAVATVCGFPLGATCFRAKAFEAAEVVRHGAVEVDMVAAIGRMKGGEWGYVTDDIRAVVEAAAGALVKVIIESAALTPDELVRACEAAQAAGAKGVKIVVKGRIGGAEIARAERYVEGALPLQTLVAEIDYGQAEARTTYGLIGIKVWIYLGQKTAAAKKKEAGHAPDAQAG